MKYPVVDLHCDLLGCIAENPSKLHFESSEINCSIPQLEEGGVLLQTFAIAVIAPKVCTQLAAQQVLLYQELLKKYPGRVFSSRSFHKNSSGLYGIFAIENALGLVREDEPLDLAFSRFVEFEKTEKILYVSLTWNQENRFGGGNVTSIGLKRDGEVFLEFLQGKKTAIDLSHTSDALAYDIINTIHKKNLKVTPIASHSNFRNIVNDARNLPNEIVKEIIALGGVIGLNFVRRFIGDTEEDIARQIEHALLLGAEQSLCLGSDFYGGITLPKHLIPGMSYPIFQEKISNSSCYPYLAQVFEKRWGKKLTEQIFSKNALAFLQRQALIPKEAL